MSRTAAPRTRSGRASRPIGLALVLVCAALIGTLAAQSASSFAQSFSDIRGEGGGATTESNGALPSGTTVFDDYAGVANLDSALLEALRKATTDAEDDGLELSLNSGWRSSAYQDELRLEAVAKYGSEQEAARWVATADTSAHVTGDAVDIGSADAIAWLSAHGARYGLCQIYRNESWHFELRTEAIGRDCPAMYADPAQDPRMQR